MSAKEQDFKDCVASLLRQGVYPSPHQISNKLFYKDGNYIANMSSTQYKWRNEVYDEFEKNNPGHPLIALRYKRQRKNNPKRLLQEFKNNPSAIEAQLDLILAR